MHIKLLAVVMEARLYGDEDVPCDKRRRRGENSKIKVEAGTRWWHRKCLSPSSSTYVPNPHLHMEQFILRRREA